MENQPKMIDEEGRALERVEPGDMVAGVERRQGFGTEIATRTAETASLAVAAQARAAIEARYVMALQRPRSWDGVRSRLLAEAKRPGFARVARYAKPMGGAKVVGPSIRFAEAALRCMSNVAAETMVVYSDAEKTIVRVTVTDLEGNVPMSKDVVVERRVERSRVSPGQKVYGQRVNSYGKTTYLVEATDDDMVAKEGSLVSKAMRNLVLRLLPGDILDDVIAQVDATAQDTDARDPSAARKAVADAFAGIGVSVEDLERYLRHPLAACSPPEITNLRTLYVGIRDGATTWRDVLDERAAEEAAATSAASAATDQAARPNDAKAATKRAAAAVARATGSQAAPQATNATGTGARDGVPENVAHSVACATCQGTGNVERDGKPLAPCSDCGGSGAAPAARKA